MNLEITFICLLFAFTFIFLDAKAFYKANAKKEKWQDQNNFRLIPGGGFYLLWKFGPRE